MSVIIKINGMRWIFTKGAPEVIAGLCEPISLAVNFDEKVRE